MKYLVLLLFFLLHTAVDASAQERLTLDDAIRLALEQNHQIEVARNNEEIARNSVHIGNAGLLPKLDASASSNYSDRESSGSALTDGASTTTSAQLQLSYTLFDGLGNVARLKRLIESGRLGELTARRLIENTLFQVSTAYYAVAAAEESYRIARELAAISRERLQRAKNRSVFGQANAIEVLAAQVDLNADSVTVTQARYRLDEARRQLNLLLNREIDRSFTVDGEVVFPETVNLGVLEQKAVENNADYLIARHQRRRSHHDLRLAQSARLPRVDIDAAYSLNRTESDLNLSLSDPDRTLRTGVQLSLNLFNGFQTRIGIQNARLELENVKQLEQEAELILHKELKDAYEAYLNSRTVLALEDKNEQAAELNFVRTEELYGLGQVTTTQFREAQLNLIRARSSISNAKYNAKLNEIELLRLSGMLMANLTFN